MKTKTNSSGFTLLELLITMSILTILITLTVTLLNPAAQFSKANNAKRASDISAIINAVGQYAADNKGVLPSSITTVNQSISNTDANLCSTLVPQYLASLPTDPSINNGSPVSDCNQPYATGYTIEKSETGNRVTISAPAAELEKEISITR